MRLYNSFDELYAVAVAVVEWHYWRAWSRPSVVLCCRQCHAIASWLCIASLHRDHARSDATFTESFYGIKRVSPRHLVSVTRRSRRHETLVHLLAVVGVPYVAQKVDALYDRLTGGRAARAFQAAADDTDGDTESDSAVRALDTGEDAHTREETDITPRANDDPPTLRLRLLPPWLLRLAIRSRPRVQKQLKRWFLRLYPYIYMIASLCGWFYRLAFMYENTAYWSPLMHVIGWSYARITPEDYVVCA